MAAALRESPECAGAVVVGSFAKDSADRLSDIDLVVFCLEGAGHSLLQTIIKQFAPSKILFTFDGMHDLDRVIDRLANAFQNALLTIQPAVSNDRKGRARTVDLCCCGCAAASPPTSVAAPLPTSGPALCQWPFPRGQAAVDLFVRPSAVGTFYSCRLPQ
ncbi:nucleotidyltransferase domain-containing protein [Paraburkholderia sp. CI2]|uniref:nucleotidyltransferase domain-containing protein n=1 Tax=Paraburkholderia sp. CI2 TaxID=2723093 RepID=UPI0039082700